MLAHALFSVTITIQTFNVCYFKNSKWKYIIKNQSEELI